MMEMRHSRRLGMLWGWLVPFRAVAETEHLPTAGRALAVAPSALSRTIRLLEDDIGQSLFDRTGRALVLNDAGRELLRGVRFAMRHVDEALSRIDPGHFVGAVTVSVSGPFASLYVMPALDALRREHEGLHGMLVSLAGHAVNDALKRGEIDLALTDKPFPDEDLSLFRLTEIPHRVYCGRKHPLYRDPQPSRAKLLSHAFVAPVASDDGHVPDQWPAELEREISLSVTQMQVGIDACARGTHLAVLPVPVAESAGLRAVRSPRVPSATLYAQHRPSLEVPGRTELLRAAIEEVVAAVGE
ncbi:MAG: LysR family transcriptional regulator [Deltaproteobacteria bacterium]|nr:LysR family transcriptional regulator [Deltaproteobacteria bacterium]